MHGMLQEIVPVLCANKLSSAILNFVQIISLLMSDPLIRLLSSFRHITLAERELITSSFEWRSYREDAVLTVPDRICKELFFICEGVLRIMSCNDKGVEVTHYFLGEDRFCTILNSFNNNVPAAESIQAACDCKVLAVSRSSLGTLYGQLPWLQPLVTAIQQQALLDKIAIRNAYLGYDAAKRYELFVSLQADVATRVSLNDVASYLGITPQSLSRIRKSRN